MDIREYNEIAWDNEVLIKSKWTVEVDSNIIDLARKGVYDIVLTPQKSVPKSWLGDIKNKNVLCLACGGGQQAPILSALGANVTVFDNSQKQLSKDDLVKKRDNLNLSLEKGDMRDLSRFDDETFDIIFHPVSNCFIDDVNSVWKECYRVLKKNGKLLSGFANPINYIFDYLELEKNNLVVKYSIPYSDFTMLPEDELNHFIKNKEPLIYGHSLSDQIGGQLSAGFIIEGFYEDKVPNRLLDNYINTYMATKSIKL